MGGDIVGGWLHPSLLKEEKRRQSFFSSQGSNHSRGEIMQWVLGGFEESALFQLAHIVFVVHATIGDWNPTKQKGTCILPTTQASYYFWVLVSMSVSSREVAADKKTILAFVFKQESQLIERPYNEAHHCQPKPIAGVIKHFEQLWHFVWISHRLLRDALILFCKPIQVHATLGKDVLRVLNYLLTQNVAFCMYGSHLDTRLMNLIFQTHPRSYQFGRRCESV